MDFDTLNIQSVFTWRINSPLETEKLASVLREPYVWHIWLNVQMCGPQIRLCVFTFRPISSKQLNSLTTIETLSWLAGAVVTHPLSVQEFAGSISGSGKGFYVWFFVLLLLCFYFLSNYTLFVANFCNSFFNVNLFSILKHIARFVTDYKGIKIQT